MAETVRYCADCRHIEDTGWAGFGGIKKCKLLNKELPDGGNTPACQSFEGGGFSHRCSECARFEEGTLGFGGRCIKGYPTWKGRDTPACKKFVRS